MGNLRRMLFRFRLFVGGIPRNWSTGCQPTTEDFQGSLNSHFGCEPVRAAKRYAGMRLSEITDGHPGDGGVPNHIRINVGRSGSPRCGFVQMVQGEPKIGGHFAELHFASLTPGDRQRNGPFIPVRAGGNA